MKMYLLVRPFDEIQSSVLLKETIRKKLIGSCVYIQDIYSVKKFVPLGEIINVSDTLTDCEIELLDHMKVEGCYSYLRPRIILVDYNPNDEFITPRVSQKRMSIRYYNKY